MLIGSTPQPLYGAWKSGLIGGGGYIQVVAISPAKPTVAYAWVDVGGFYRSDNGGKSWRMLHGSTPHSAAMQGVRSISVHPANPNEIVIAAGDHWSPASGGLFRSTDGGKTVRKVTSTVFGANADHRWTGLALARANRNPSVMLAATLGDGVFRSADGGKSWKKALDSDACFTDVRFSPVNDQLAWASAQPYDNWLGEKRAKLPGGFFRSKDGGETWAKLAETGPSEIVVESPRRLVGIFEGGHEIRQSRDNGETWTSLTDGLRLDAKDNSFTSDSVYQSLAVTPSHVLTASSRGTFYRLPKGGQKWQKLPEPKLKENYVAQPWHARWEGTGWRHFGSALASITVDPSNPRRWFFTDWYAIYRSEDAGVSWNLSMDYVESTVIHCIVPGGGNMVHLGMADNGYFRSLDGGVRYANAKVNSNMKCIAVDPSNRRRLFAVGDPGNGSWFANTLYASEDAGGTWTRPAAKGLPDMSKLRANTLAIDPVRPNTLRLGVSGKISEGGGVYESTDGGANFRAVNDGLPPDLAPFRSDIWGVGRELAVLDLNGKTVWLLASHDTWQVYLATDGTWKELKGASGKPNDVISHKGKFWLATGGGLDSFDPANEAWAKAFAKPAYRLAAARKRIAVGHDDGVLLSTDDGRTWEELGQNLPNRVRPIPAIIEHRLVVGTGGSGVFWRDIPR